VASQRGAGVDDVVRRIQAACGDVLVVEKKIANERFSNRNQRDLRGAA
jgi:hypothetical protein